jgi:hypothetical protein
MKGEYFYRNVAWKKPGRKSIAPLFDAHPTKTFIDTLFKAKPIDWPGHFKQNSRYHNQQLRLSKRALLWNYFGLALLI